MKAAVRGVACLLVLLASCEGFGQDVPSEIRPFVKLGFEAGVQVYRNPIIRNGQVVENGTLAGSKKTVLTLGSGTVVTRDGLILTNQHVYEPVSKPTVEYDAQRNLLVKVTPLSPQMVVFENDALDPLKSPEPKYRAELLISDEELDIAILRIASYVASGQPVQRQDFAHVNLGNPYGIPWQQRLVFVGYPGKGGETVTITEGKFLGYTKGVQHVTDGAIKTDGVIAGGNSGGSALFRNSLVGIPTQVSAKSEKGSDFGYLHPATWAIRSLAFVTLRYGQQIPEVDRRWVDSPHNTDLTRTHAFVGGKAVSAQSASTLEGVQVVIHRADRTFEQIVELDQEISMIRAALRLRRLLDAGLTPEQAAQRLEISGEVARQLMEVRLDDEALSLDVRRYAQGEFFYSADRSRKDGFFFAPVPRNQPLRAVFSKDGFRRAYKQTPGFSGDSLYVNVGSITMYGQGQ